MLQIALWKRVVILGLCALGLLMALPNAFYAKVEGHNDAVAAIVAAGATPEREAAAAAWPSWMPSKLVNLGLDLRGGAHLLAEVQVADVYADRMDAFWPEVRDALRGEREAVGTIRREPSAPDVLRVRISEPAGLARAMEVIRGLATPVVSLAGIGSSDIVVSGAGNEIIDPAFRRAEKQATDGRTMQQSLEIIRRRIDEVGTREPTIQRQGEDRILIQVPGIGSASELKSLIGTTAQLTFNRGGPERTHHRCLERPARPRARSFFPSMDEEGVLLSSSNRPRSFPGEELVDAQPSFDQNGQPAVSFRFDTTGARKFGDYTAAEYRVMPFAIVLDNEVISAPVIQAHIAGGSGIITGNFSVEESTQLAVLSARRRPAGRNDIP
jgi:preprotein translocase subunit SecD